MEPVAEVPLQNPYVAYLQTPLSNEQTLLTEQPEQSSLLLQQKRQKG